MSTPPPPPGEPLKPIVLPQGATTGETLPPAGAATGLGEGEYVVVGGAAHLVLMLPVVGRKRTVVGGLSRAGLRKGLHEHRATRDLIPGSMAGHVLAAFAAARQIRSPTSAAWIRSDPAVLR